jgi:hypothetical protein
MIPGPRLARHRQQATLFTVLLLFNLMLIILQIWLFTATLENMLAGKPAMAIPAAAASLACAAINVWMLVGLYRVDREPDTGEGG